MIRVVAALLAISLSTPAAALVGGAGSSSDASRSIVMIIGARGNLCTGAALARDLVLTAAHCVAPASSYKILPSKNAPVIAISTIAVHPHFDPASYAKSRATADVAMLKLANPLPATIVPVGLSDGARVARGDRFVIAGFGISIVGDDTSIGMAYSASLIATGQPGSLQVRLVDPSTKGERPGLGACTGDSGGPAFRDIGGRLAVMGVVSWSTGPGNAVGCGGLTGVTPLALYRGWILDTARKMGSALAP